MTERNENPKAEQGENIDTISIKGMIYGAGAGAALGIAVSEGIIWSTASAVKAIYGSTIDISTFQSWRLIQDSLIGTAGGFTGSTFGMLYRPLLNQMQEMIKKSEALKLNRNIKSK